MRDLSALHVVDVDRSAVWLQTQYKSMQDNGFVTYGPSEIVDAELGE